MNNTIDDELSSSQKPQDQGRTHLETGQGSSGRTTDPILSQQQLALQLNVEDVIDQLSNNPINTTPSFPLLMPSRSSEGQEVIQDQNLNRPKKPISFKASKYQHLMSTTPKTHFTSSPMVFLQYYPKYNPNPTSENYVPRKENLIRRNNADQRQEKIGRLREAREKRAKGQAQQQQGPLYPSRTDSVLKRKRFKGRFAKETEEEKPSKKRKESGDESS